MITLKDFEPLEQVGDDRKVSFRARSRATGVPLVIHLFRGTSFNEGTRVIAMLSALPEAERSRILDFGQEHGVVFFLTQDLPGNMGFPDWLNSALHPGQSVAVPLPVPMPPPPIQSPPIRPRPKNSPPSESPGEFTAFYNRRQEAESDSGSNTTEDFNGFYQKAQSSPPGSLDTLGLQKPPVRVQRSPDPSAGGRAIRPDAKNEFQPIFPLEASLPARTTDREPRRAPDRHPRVDVSRTPPRAPLGPALKPLLLTLGIILGVALIVVLIMRIF